MLKGSRFGQCIAENELLLKDSFKRIYEAANSILQKHPLYQYFKKYLGGFLIIMDPDGTILSADDDELGSELKVGYVHPLEQDRYYQNAIAKAKSLLNNDHTRSYDALEEAAGAIKLNSGVIFSYSGFEFLELKEDENHESYEDIFEIINLFTFLTRDFFNPQPHEDIDPFRYSFEKQTDQKSDIIREEILYSLSQEELIDIATKISTTGLQYNFSLLNELFVLKVLLETGFVDIKYVEGLIKIGSYQVSAK